jgi:heavy metal sensor kinase
MKFLLKISTKLTLWYMISSGIIIVVMAVAMYYIYDFERRRSIDEDLQDYGNFLTSGLATQKGDLSEVYDKLFEKKNYQTLRQRLHRFVLVSNDSIIFEAGLNMNLDSIVGDTENEEDFFWKTTYNTINTNNIEYRTYSLPLASKIKKEYRLIVFTSLERFYESLAQLQYIMMLITPLALILSALIGLIIARNALAPVRMITETASSISYSNLNSRVLISSSSKDELTLLASTFNSMIERLEKTFLVQKRFIADASHDLRTPLTIIQIELEMLLNKKEISDEIKQIIEKCLKETEMMTNLAENLLLLARYDSNQLILNKELVRLDELILECVSQLNNLAKNNDVKFIIDIEDSVTMNADLNLIRRLLINIIDNSIKYSYRNEKITISLQKYQNHAQVIVNNIGIPIPEEVMGKIFNRFQRADEARTSDGFGLGLSIAKAITEAHNGEIYIDSSEKDGTSVSLHFKDIIN